MLRLSNKRELFNNVRSDTSRGMFEMLGTEDKKLDSEEKQQVPNRAGLGINMIGVIIVEDHEATLKGLQAELSCEPDVRVLGTATNSLDGLELAKVLKPDVVLLDLHLPDSSGPKSLAEMFCSLPGTNIIVLSADNRLAVVQIVLQTGVSGYLLKSEPVAKVADAIREVMAGRQPVVSSELFAGGGNTKLTEAEQQLLRMMARGMKYQDIADLRVTSSETVRKQINLLLAKLELRSREELIVWAVDNGYSKVELEL